MNAARVPRPLQSNMSRLVLWKHLHSSIDIFRKLIAQLIEILLGQGFYLQCIFLNFFWKGCATNRYLNIVTFQLNAKCSMLARTDWRISENYPIDALSHHSVVLRSISCTFNTSNNILLEEFYSTFHIKLGACQEEKGKRAIGIPHHPSPLVG